MKIGFIGCGNMGSALAKAVAKAVNPEDIYLSGGSSNKAQLLALELKANSSTNMEIAKTCDYIFLGVKPKLIPVVLDEISSYLTEDKVVISMAAVVTVDELTAKAGKAAVLRIMPNTPVAVGKGIILYCAGATLAEDKLERALEFLRYAGEMDSLPETLMNAGMALTGCGPAYVYMFMEALADGAVASGLPREKAMVYAAETILGAAELAIQTGKHPGTLKDEVASPGGATIKGIYALEKGGMRGAVISAILANKN